MFTHENWSRPKEKEIKNGSNGSGKRVRQHAVIASKHRDLDETISLVMLSTGERKEELEKIVF